MILEAYFSLLTLGQGKSKIIQGSYLKSGVKNNLKIDENVESSLKIN